MKLENIIAIAILGVIITAAALAYSNADKLVPDRASGDMLRIVANCKNGQIDVPYDGRIFVPAVRAGYKPEAVIPIPPNCER